jgi:uncharacterized protein (DUF342 family)
MTQHFQIDPTTAADDFHSLLRVIADPATHKARLDELVEHQKAVDEKIAAHEELIAKTRGMHSKAEATNIVLENRKAALDARESEIELKAQALATAETLRSDAALGRRERAVAAREEAAKREADRLATLKVEYEGKIKKLAHALNEAS